MQVLQFRHLNTPRPPPNRRPAMRMFESVPLTPTAAKPSALSDAALVSRHSRSGSLQAPAASDASCGIAGPRATPPRLERAQALHGHSLSSSINERFESTECACFGIWPPLIPLGFPPTRTASDLCRLSGIEHMPGVNGKAGPPNPDAAELSFGRVRRRRLAHDAGVRHGRLVLNTIARGPRHARSLAPWLRAAASTACEVSVKSRPRLPNDPRAARPTVRAKRTVARPAPVHCHGEWKSGRDLRCA